MKSGKTQFLFLILSLLTILSTSPNIRGQENRQLTRGQLLDAARELMIAARYCALITVDQKGIAHARTMDAFPPSSDFVVWLATNPKSRKVLEIRRNPHVSLYYFDPVSQGYVTVYGRARLVNDPKEKATHWKDDWKLFYPDRDQSYLLIAVEPERMEVVIVSKNIVGNSAAWTAPVVTFSNSKRRH